MTGEPIHDAMMVVEDGRIREVGSYRAIKTDGVIVDLGDVAILPSLVNAHTHLEFSDLASPIGNRGMELADWLGQVVQTRGTVDTPNRNANMRRGHAEAVASGTGLIGDIITTSSESTFTHEMDRTIAFAEVLGLTASRGDEKLTSAKSCLDFNESSCVAISPHAPYSTPRSLIDSCVSLAMSHNVPLAMHVAESPAERELLCNGTGPLADSLAAMGLPVEEFFPWSVSKPFLKLIAKLAQAPRALVVHGNDFDSAEISAIATHEHLSVVYCPRTHDYFGHARHPLADLHRVGVNVALGTDSRASNPDLNLWGEVQFLLRHRPDIDPAVVLRMATTNGAVALGCGETHGQLSVGRQADFITVTTTAKTLDGVYSDFATASVSSPSSAATAPQS